MTQSYQQNPQKNNAQGYNDIVLLCVTFDVLLTVLNNF